MEGIRQNEIVYGILSHEHFDDVEPIAVDQFVLGEALCRSLKCTPEDFKPMLSDGVREWLKDGASYGAWDSGTGKLVGVAIATLLTNEEKPLFWGLLKPTNPKTQIYVEFEKMIEGAVDIFELYPSAKKILELNLLCILPSYRGRRIGQNLAMHLEKHGRENQCTMAMAEASGRASQRILSKLGYRTVFEYQYEDFEIDGKKVFDVSVMGEDLFDKIMVKDLSTTKSKI